MDLILKHKDFQTEYLENCMLFKRYINMYVCIYIILKVKKKSDKIYFKQDAWVKIIRDIL